MLQMSIFLRKRASNNKSPNFQSSQGVIGRHVRLEEHGNTVFCCAFSGESETHDIELATAAYDGTTRIWDVAKCTQNTSKKSKSVHHLLAPRTMTLCFPQEDIEGKLRRGLVLRVLVQFPRSGVWVLQRHSVCLLERQVSDPWPSGPCSRAQRCVLRFHGETSCRYAGCSS